MVRSSKSHASATGIAKSAKGQARAAEGKPTVYASVKKTKVRKPKKAQSMGSTGGMETRKKK